MSSIVIGFAGRIGSGKTTISENLAQTLKFKRVSFGDFVRQEAVKRGYNPDSREILQTIGAQLIEKGWTTFCKSVLQSGDWNPGDPLVIDGIRHIDCVKEIKKLVFPQRFILIYISIDDVQRYERLTSRGTDDIVRLGQIEKHSTEAQVAEALPLYSDAIVDSAYSEEEIIDRILEVLRK